MALSLVEATSEDPRFDITVVCIGWGSRFTDHNLVKIHSVRRDLKDGCLGPGGRRDPKEIVAVGIFIGALCRTVDLERSRQIAVVVCAHDCRTGRCTSQSGLQPVGRSSNKRRQGTFLE